MPLLILLVVVFLSGLLQDLPQPVLAALVLVAVTGLFKVKALARLWEVQRADGAWDWLDFGLEPYETSDAVFHGATVAAKLVKEIAGMMVKTAR